MRKVDPTDLCLDLINEIIDMRKFYISAAEALSDEAHADKQLSLLSEIVFHQSYVMLESFISAWFIGCINRDASVYLRFREKSIRDSVGEKFDAKDNSWLSYSPPPHPDVNVLAKLLDKEEKNITFKTYAKMECRAKEWLSITWSSKISSIALDRQANINAAKAIRNCIAHRSQSSFREMNNVLQNLPNTDTSTLLRRNINAVNNVGAYLKALPLQQGKTRVEIFLDEFTQFADSLKVVE